MSRRTRIAPIKCAPRGIARLGRVSFPLTLHVTLKYRIQVMPLSAETAPHCPTCRSELTERSPFTGSLVPVYVCLACGHRWRQALAKADSGREPATVKRPG